MMKKKTEIVLLVEKVPTPNNGLIINALSRVDYTDTYQVQLPENIKLDIDKLARSFINASPAWAKTLMSIRNKLVLLVGLKSLTRKKTASTLIAPGQPLGIFRIIAKSSNELLIGEDDEHLNFRVCLRISESVISTTTVVQYKNWLGKVYFFLICVFHRKIAKDTLKQMATELLTK